MKPKDKKKKQVEEQAFEKALFYTLKKNGHLFPVTLDDVEKFEELFGDTEIDLPEHLQSYEDLLNSKNKKNTLTNLNLGISSSTSESKNIFIRSKNDRHEKEKSVKPGRVDYYKRILLAAEIVYQLHKEPTLGHLKLQKIIYLSQEVNNMHLPINFLRQAAGPYDPRMARSLDKKLNEKKWFKYQKGEYLKYLPLEKAGEHLIDFKKYFPNELERIHFLIDTFRTAKSIQVELVATLYACWKEIIKSNEPFSIILLTNKVYQWSDQKKKFSSNRIERAIHWMEEIGIKPNS